MDIIILFHFGYILLVLQPKSSSIATIIFFIKSENIICAPHRKISDPFISSLREFKIIDLITIKNKYKTNIHCGSIQINIQEKIANIISLGRSQKCLYVNDSNIKFSNNQNPEGKIANAIYPPKQFGSLHFAIIFELVVVNHQTIYAGYYLLIH